MSVEATLVFEAFVSEEFVEVAAHKRRQRDAMAGVNMHSRKAPL